MRTKRADHIGRVINDIKILRWFTIREVSKNRTYFECLCVCKKTFTIRADGILNGKIKSCGCLTGDLISASSRLPDNQGAKNKVFSHYMCGAKDRGHEFSIQKDEFMSFISNDCYYCGAKPKEATIIKPDDNNGRRSRTITYNGIDRIDNSKGYVKGNCVTCCSSCNYSKRIMLVDEWLDLCARVAAKHPRPKV